MSEEEASAAIIRWAKGYFAPELDDPEPEVEIVSISHDENHDEWTAELEVSTSADNPTITCWFLDEGHQLEENRIQIENIEY